MSRLLVQIGYVCMSLAVIKFSEVVRFGEILLSIKRYSLNELFQAR